ncbi:phage repressor protein CI [Vibrio fluvialis]|nr:phage repressor protein CI [Vibrio fluvialis]
MSELQDQIPPFKYIGGREVTERMKEVTKAKDFKSLGDILSISKGTISTWHQRDLTPFEVIVRLHLKTGASIRYLALGEGEPFPDSETIEHTSKNNEPKSLFDMDVFNLVNGKLIGNNTLAFDKSYLDKSSIVNVMAVESDSITYIIDKEVRQAVSGTYLVDMDGLLSLNEIQRLPGKKLAISFNGSTIQVDELDVKVVGRVAVVVEKKQ